MSSGEDDSSEAYEPEYEQEQVTIHLPSSSSSLELVVWSVLPPPLEYMATLHTQSVEISGRQVWTGSFVLAYHLVHKGDLHREWFSMMKTTASGLSILELGCGTGLLGMALAKAFRQFDTTEPDQSQELESDGADQHEKSIETRENGQGIRICLTDGDPKAVGLLQQNLEANCLIDSSSLSSSQLTSTTIHVEARQLLWGRAEAKDFLFSMDPYETPPKKWDMIVAGDVLYKEELPVLFFETVWALLRDSLSQDGDGDEESNSIGMLWLCHVPRSTVTHEIVQDAARAAKFSIETMTYCHATTIDETKVDDDSDEQQQGRADSNISNSGVMNSRVRDLILESDLVPREDLDRAIIYQMKKRP